MLLSAGKRFVQLAGTGSYFWLPVFCIPVFIFIFTTRLYGQVPEIDIHNSRLLVNHPGIDIYSKSNDALFVSFLPQFSYKNIVLPWRDPSKTGLHGQKTQTFSLVNGKWGFIENGTELYYQNSQVKLIDSFSYGLPPFADIFQASKNPVYPNCFYLVNTRAHKSRFSSDNMIKLFLHLQHFCVDANGALSRAMFQTIYIGQIDDRLIRYTQAGWKADSEDGKTTYFHIFNPLDTNLHIYKLENDKLKETDKYYYPALAFINDINISANSKVLALNNDNPAQTRGASYNQREIYIHSIADGKTISAVPDTIRPFTYDTLQKHIVKFSYVQLSPSGRFLYVVETSWRPEDRQEVKFGNTSGTYTYANEEKARLLQVDLAGMGTPGFKPKIRILKEWAQASRCYRVYPQTVPIDGKLYFSVEDVKINPKDYCDTTISLWRLNNIETDTVTFGSAEKMIDNLEFPVIFRDPEIFDPQNWKQYPYHTYADSSCGSEKTSLWLHTGIPFDSAIWMYDSVTKAGVHAPDTLVQMSLPAGRHKMKCHVYRSGFEDVLYTEVNVKTASTNYDSLRRLPKIIYGCEGNEIWLKPGTDTLAEKANWTDGTAGTERKVTDSGKYVWRVYYKNSPCPRLDTVEVKLTNWNKIKLKAISKCDTSSAIIQVENMEPQMKWKWYNNDSLSLTNTVAESGKYCITIHNTLAHCSQQFCTEVMLYKSNIPDWANKDTTICEGEILEIKPDSSYILQCAEGTENINGNCIISQAGNYIFQYKKQTAENICGWKAASINVTVPGIGSDICPKTSHCTWYIPNAFTPDKDNINEQWLPVCNCPAATYKLIIYNRWGEKIFEGNNTGWEGKLKEGVRAPQGIYFYLLETKHPDKTQNNLSGTIHLLK